MGTQGKLTGRSGSADTSSEPNTTRRRWRDDSRRRVWRRGQVRRLAAASALGIAGWLIVTTLQPGPPEQVAVVVAATEVELGSMLAAESVQLQHLPPDAVPAGAYTDPDSVLGYRVVGAIRPGEVITDARLHPHLAPTTESGVVFVQVTDGPVTEVLHAGDLVDLVSAEGKVIAGAAQVTGVVRDGQPPGVFVAVPVAQSQVVAAHTHPMALGVSVVIRSHSVPDIDIDIDIDID